MKQNASSEKTPIKSDEMDKNVAFGFDADVILGFYNVSAACWTEINQCFQINNNKKGGKKEGKKAKQTMTRGRKRQRV